MRTLVTGATGFVGGAVVRRLLADGDDVVAYVRETERAAPLTAAGADVREGSIGDPNAIADAAAGCEVVVHCAAVSDLRAAPRALTWVNVAGTENVVNAARHAECRRIVHLSCADVTLDNRDRVNWNESQELMGMPLGHHARSKRLGEEIALTRSSEALGIVAIRPAWIWGPGDDSRLPGLCAEGLRGGVRLVGRGDNLVAITYIDNLVDAIVAAMHADDRAVGQAYYVADNEFLSVREFVTALSQALGLPEPRTGVTLPLAHAMARFRALMGGSGMTTDEVVRRGRATTFDISASLGDLGWEPKVGLDDGMDAVSSWASDIGGPDAIAKRMRPPETAASVDDQVAAAGGD